jgi:hypothetical protein
MYNFERGKDPKETLEVGAKKDAIKITGLGYFHGGKEHHIQNPIKAKVFLDRLKSGELPNDPIFGIESVFVWHEERWMEEDWGANIKKSMSAGGISRHSMGKEYKEGKSTTTYELKEIQGKVLDICGKLIMFPTLDELENAGFGYLKGYLEGEEMLREEEERINGELASQLHELKNKELEEIKKKQEEELERKEAELRKMKEYNDETRLPSLVDIRNDWGNDWEDYQKKEEGKRNFGTWLKENWKFGSK